ncbi:mandelate racemase/muconate lactonizing protein [Jimgerdemannia flammicorona]|uniref:Mandelate racemase/muconate lactonizing protein n=1 Tax=Jimgerdemannia flammicorona TaxID=994334 RepID=A0A433PV17_9FUNG|nr:mandelate racemase/muconate lactonizing protein [Jimgerdemannia flammicorona]
MFIEESVLVENMEAFREITRHTTIPIDGFTECKKIASMAEAYDVALAPHCPLGPIALAACLDATCYNAIIQIQLSPLQSRRRSALDYLKDKTVFEYGGGLVKISEGPGLGVEIDEKFVRETEKTGHQ